MCCLCGQVYLDAWKYVKSLLPSVSEERASPAHAAIKKLVDNWTCPEFEQFVETLAGIVNGWVFKCFPVLDSYLTCTWF